MKHKKKLISGLILTSLTYLPFSPYWNDCLRPIAHQSKFYNNRIKSEPIEKKVVNEGRIERIGNINVVYVTGSPYEMGFQQGKLLKHKIQKNRDTALETCYNKLSEEIGLPVGKIATNFVLDEAYNKMEPYIPNDYKEEMIGISDGSGVSLKDVHRVHAIPELTETSCSGIAAFGKATKDGKLYQVRLLDYIMEFGIQENPTIIVYNPNYGNRFVNIGWAGFTGVISGMNEQGIAISEMGYGRPGKKLPGTEPYPEETIQGIPMIFLLKKVLQYSDNVEQATGILKSSDKTNYYVYIIGDGITENGNPEARAFITTIDFCKVYKPNHSDYPIPQLEDILYGSHKNEECFKQLKESYGKINPDLLMKVINPAIAMDSNLQAIIYEPGNLKFWVANSRELERACDQEYVKFDFGKAINY